MRQYATHVKLFMNKYYVILSLACGCAKYDKLTAHSSLYERVHDIVNYITTLKITGETNKFPSSFSIIDRETEYCGKCQQTHVCKIESVLSQVIT